MSVVGNNLANVSTVGYKASNMHFDDALSQFTHTTSGLDQIGRGVMMETIMGDFSQGSLERTNDTLDVSISGNGFFVVQKPGEHQYQYTRAGNFRFDKDGYYVEPHGLRVQGWEVDHEASRNQGNAVIKGDITDVRLENMQSPPEATTEVRMKANLNSKELERAGKLSSGDPAHAGRQDDPFKSMFNAWNYNPADPNKRPLGDQMYAVQDTMRVYDENGGSHELTIYFDPINDTRLKAAANGDTYWEFIVAVPPNEDNRQFWSGQTTAGPNGEHPQAKRGVLMTGTLHFSPGGKLLNMSAYTVNQPYADPTATGKNDPVHGDISTNLERWQTANLSEDGYPVCTANFLGTLRGDVTKYDNSAATTNIPDVPADEVATNTNIKIDFGIRSRAGTFTAANSPANDLRDIDLDHDGTTLTDYTINDIPQTVFDRMAKLNEPEYDTFSLTSYNQKSSIIDHAQNGYGVGSLRNVSISQDGVLTGHYTNGQQIDHYKLGLAVFRNQYGLVREGGNLFTETRESGQALIGQADTTGRGKVVGNHLENSNVDMAAEFVKMITTEKGFQANSKVVTTSDAMLTTVIQMKR